MFKRALLNIGLLLSSLLFGGILLEAGLRQFPNRYERQFDADKNRRATHNYISRDGGLYTLRPEHSFRQAAACIDINHISTNRQGFRGPEWRRTAGRRILLLGDSLVEGLQVADNEVMGSRLSELLNGHVASAGVSGYSTLTEWLAYRALIRPYRADIVVLAFYAGNDVEANSCKRSRNPSLPCVEIAGGLPVVVIPGQKPQTASTLEEKQLGLDIGQMKAFLRSWLVSYQLLHELKYFISGLLATSSNDGHKRWDIYRASQKEAVEEAWSITKGLLEQIKLDVEADGARLVLLGIPEHLTLSLSWRKELRYNMGYAAPEDFDPRRPIEKLSEVAAQLGLPMLDPTELLSDYRDRHGLPYPYFSFTCDGHLNPLGHDLIAHLLAAWLDELDGGRQASSTGMRRDERFAQKPQSILGQDAYRAIYEGGVYRGNARTSEPMQ